MKKTQQEITSEYETAGTPEAGPIWEAYEGHYYRAGAYLCAVESEEALNDAIRIEHDPDRRAVLRQAREWRRAYGPNICKQLHACKTSAGRARIMATAKADRHARQEIAVALAGYSPLRNEAMIAHEADKELDRDYKKAVVSQTQRGKKPDPDTPGKPTKRKSYLWKHQEIFAKLWCASRNSGVLPLARNFLAEYKDHLASIGVTTKEDVKRIKDCARKNGLIPPWNTRKNTKRRKSDG